MTSTTWPPPVTKTGFDIGPKHIGDGAPCLIVAEVGQAHEGSLALAHSYIDMIAEFGADAVKFQCHLAAAESTPGEPWRVEPRWKQDVNRYDYWRRMEFTPEQWAGLKEHADALGLIFLCSPFSVEAVRLLDPLVPAWKVPSGEVLNGPLLRAMADTGKPAIISTGMTTFLESVSPTFMGHPYECRPVAYMLCTSKYPTPPEQIGLNLLVEWRRGGLNAPVGLSDHSGTIYPGLAAITLGCDILEVHVKLAEVGFDAAASLYPEDLMRLVEGVRFIERAKAHPVDKDAMAQELEPIRELFLRKWERKQQEKVLV